MALDLSALDGSEINPQLQGIGFAPRAALASREEDPENP